MFKIKQKTKMGKVFAAYASRKGVQQSSFRFIFDGERIDEHQTPMDLEMEENDLIDCMIEQTGGY